MLMNNRNDFNFVQSFNNTSKLFHDILGKANCFITVQKGVKLKVF